MKYSGEGYSYILEEDFCTFVRNDLNKKRQWDLTAAFKVKTHLSLLEQHAGRELLEGPLHLDCTFYLKYRGPVAIRREVQQEAHMARPYLSALLLLLEAVGVDTIFKSAAAIVSIDTRKYYDSEYPRVEFKLFETQKDLE